MIQRHATVQWMFWAMKRAHGCWRERAATLKSTARFLGDVIRRWQAKEVSASTMDHGGHGDEVVVGLVMV